MSLPILYSFRRCPYAIRARLALLVSNIDVEIREVKLSNKPVELLSISPKGTVPVLQLVSGEVLDESLDIMDWAYQHSALTREWQWDKLDHLINSNDQQFKPLLDRYKYFERYNEGCTQQDYLIKCLPWLDHLENILHRSNFLFGSQPSFIDLAIFPFIRQFAKVDEQWFLNSTYSKTIVWLNYWLEHDLFTQVMKKI